MISGALLSGRSLAVTPEKNARRMSTRKRPQGAIDSDGVAQPYVATCSLPSLPHHYANACFAISVASAAIAALRALDLRHTAPIVRTGAG